MGDPSLLKRSPYVIPVGPKLGCDDLRVGLFGFVQWKCTSFKVEDGVQISFIFFNGNTPKSYRTKVTVQKLAQKWLLSLGANFCTVKTFVR